MKEIKLITEVGSFAEDKDAAARLRNLIVRPAIQQHESLVLDFRDVRLATQSFIHALVSDVLRKQGEAALSLIEFRGCNQAVRGIIETVVQYSVEAAESGNQIELVSTKSR